MGEKVYGEQYRTIIICADAYENRVLRGRIYNPYFENGVCFESTMDFLKIIKYMLEEMNTPQSFTAYRCFRKEKRIEITEASNGMMKNGRKTTFVLRILFGQHTSWQGILTWPEGKKEEKFRSALELLFLMDSALEGVD